MFGIDDAIAAGSKLIDDIVTRIWPDATEVEKAKLAQLSSQIQNEYNLVLAQLKVNEIEAANPHVFVAGWRPFIGWIGGLGLGYELLFKPIVNGLLLVFGMNPFFPGVDINLLQTVVGGILGLGLARTWEKTKDVATSQIGKK
jgi:hypothetical protein